jgi:hypothetical protein
MKTQEEIKSEELITHFQFLQPITALLAISLFTRIARA